MILYIDYGNGARFQIQLLDTPVVKKWTEVFQKNNQIFDGSIYTRHSGITNNQFKTNSRDLQHAKGTHNLRNKLKVEINEAIQNVNKYIKGEPFPYEAFEHMSIQDTQKIHRSFTTGAITKKCWNDRIPHDILLELKKINKGPKWRIYNKFCPTTFEILDHEKFNYWTEKINVLIHSYEPYIVLPRAVELTDQNADPELMFHEWNNRNDAGQIDNSIDVVPTVEEVLDSFKGKSYIDNDVFIHSGIYGKSYLETYVEEDPPLSYDVTNVEYMTGEFIIMLDHEKKVNYFTNSGFSRWANEFPINNNLIYPIPLGKIISRNFPDKPSHLFSMDWELNKTKITYELR